MTDENDLNPQASELEQRKSAIERAQSPTTDNPDEVFAHPDEPKNRIKPGAEVNLTLKDPTLKEIMVGVGWDLKAFESDPLDLDASVFLLDREDKTRVDEDFIFYNNLQGSDGAVKHMGDSRTGAGDGDDEMMNINLQALPFDVMKIMFVLSIYPNETQEHDFSMVRNVYFRIANNTNNHEIFRYELDDELSGEEGLMIGELERIGTDWVFRAIGDTVEGGLNAIAENYGIIVAENAG
jgi:tellurium resistance protein TerD